MAADENPAPPAPFPDLDWPADRARRFGEQALDLWEEFLAKLPSLPVAGSWNQQQVARGVARQVPEEPLPDEELFDYLKELVFDWSMYPGHPRFMAYITGSGTVPGAAADLLAAGLNMNVGGWPAELEKINTAAKAARKMGMVVLAGHGLNYRNIDAIARIEEIEELNIGHSIVARAALVGVEAAVREMIALMRSPRTLPTRG